MGDRLLFLNFKIICFVGKILILCTAEPNPGPKEAYMLDDKARLARLEIIRQVAKKRQESGAHERSLEQLRLAGLDFIANPRMPISATFSKEKETEKEKEEEAEDLLSEVGDVPAPAVEDDTVALINQYGLKSRSYTGSGQKLEALWEARKILGLKPGEEVSLLKLATLAARVLQVSPSAVKNFITRGMVLAQKMALKKGLRTRDASLERELSLQDERLLALTAASIELRRGDANKTLTIPELCAKAAPGMKLTVASAENYVSKKLNAAQKKLLGLTTRMTRKG